jgi:hypothetical protein
MVGMETTLAIKHGLRHPSDGRQRWRWAITNNHGDTLLGGNQDTEAEAYAVGAANQIVAEVELAREAP